MKKLINLFSSLPASLSIILIGSLIGFFGYFLPFQFLNNYFESYKPCGNTWAGFGCVFVLYSIPMFASSIITFAGTIVIFLILRSAKAKNIILILLFSFIFYVYALPIAGVDQYFLETSLHNIYIIPVTFLSHYLIFGKIKKTAFGLRPIILSLAIWTLWISLIFGIIKIWYKG